MFIYLTATLVITATFVAYGKPTKTLTYTGNYTNVSYQPNATELDRNKTNTENNTESDLNKTNNSTENTLINGKDTSSQKIEDIRNGASDIKVDPNKTSSKTELNLKKEREEVTEKPYPKTPNDHPEITTERESEQINFARLQNRHINKNDKLQGDNENDAIDQNTRKINTELIEPAELIDLNTGENISPPKKNTKSDKLINVTNNNQRDYKENIEREKLDEPSLNEHLEAFEVSDLNDQSVYYIYHPNGLLQKVVYATKDNAENRELSAQVSYGDVAPIVEPHWTYDPNTFVFQRLQVVNSS